MAQKILCIATRPAAARAIASRFGIERERGPWFSCAGSKIVVPTRGALLKLRDVENYDQRYKTWSFDDLPIIPARFALDPAKIDGRAETLKMLGEMLSSATIVIHAGNPDREGQRDIDDVLAYFGWKGPVYRFLPFELSGACLEKLDFPEKLPPNSLPVFRNAGLSAGARARTDWLLGVNIGRAIGCRLNDFGIRKRIPANRLSIGMLGLLKLLQAEKTYRYKAIVAGAEFFLEDSPLERHELEKLVVGQKAVAREVQGSARLDLASLIGQASGRLGSAREILFMAQSLYDAGLISYPAASNAFSRAGRAPDSIVPVAGASKKLSAGEARMLKIVKDSFKAGENRRPEIEACFDGPPRTVWKGGRNLDAGVSLVCDAITNVSGKLEGVSEARLFSVMRDPVRLARLPLATPDMDESFGETPVFSMISSIENLLEKGYVEKNGGVLKISREGLDLLGYFPPRLKSPVFSVALEACFEKIGRGDMDIEAYWEYFTRHLLDGIAEIREMEYAPEAAAPCPACQGVSVLNRHKGKLYWKCRACGKTFEDKDGKPMEPAESKCPACDGKAVRLYSQKNEQHFWKCEACGKTYSDVGGELSSPHKCPACEEPALYRNESRKTPGLFYWHCARCGASFADDGGNPGRQFKEKIKAPCPACGKDAFQYESKRNPGEMFWKCQACGSFFLDDNGKPGEDADKDLPHGECPVCGGAAVQFASQKGNLLWRCKANSQHGPFLDDNGKPGVKMGEYKATGLEKAKCPHCKGEAHKMESRKKPGTFYWRCAKCGFMSDDGGKPGKVFSSK